MALQFTPELERRIEHHLTAGRYESAEDLVAEALDLFEANREAVGAELRRRHEDLRSGLVQPVGGTEAMTRLRQRLERYRPTT